MTARPFIFNAPMVRALLAGNKTQTRRLVQAPQPPTCTTRVSTWHHHDDLKNGPHFWSWGPDPKNPGCEYIQPNWWAKCPYGQPGDTLWVREDFCYTSAFGKTLKDSRTIFYEATDLGDQPRQTKLAMYMPHWASRITLEVTDVRVERLQDISEADAKSEGVVSIGNGGQNVGPNHYSVELKGGSFNAPTAREAYSMLWRYRLAPNSFQRWDANPWVWVVEFRRLV